MGDVLAEGKVATHDVSGQRLGILTKSQQAERERERERKSKLLDGRGVMERGIR